MAFVLAACAEMLYRDLPFADRVRTIHDQGLAVEIWDWTIRDLPALVATGATFTSMTGYVEGSLTDPDGARALVASAERSVEASRELGNPHLNLHGTGLDGDGLPVHPVQTVTGAMWRAAVETLGHVAELGRREGVVFCLENLNTTVDHPGTPFAHPADTAALVAAIDSPHLRMNLDLYHAQISEGSPADPGAPSPLPSPVEQRRGEPDLVTLIRETQHLVGEVQVADVPGRCEPGTGEIGYPAVARALAETGYDGVVALEAWASGDSTAALAAFRAAFDVG